MPEGIRVASVEEPLGGVYVSIVVCALIQAFWPTVTVWALLFSTFLFYGVWPALDLPGGLWDTAPTVALIAALVTGGFWLMRPWKAWPGRSTMQDIARPAGAAEPRRSGAVEHLDLTVERQARTMERSPAGQSRCWMDDRGEKWIRPRPVPTAEAERSTVAPR